MNSFKDFLAWEAASRDTIDFKKIYADIGRGDPLAGLLLSEVVYWYLPGKDGSSKLRVEKNGEMWIAVRRYDWWERTRMSPKQADRAIDIFLEELILEKDIFKFNGDPTTHLRIIEDNFLKALQTVMLNPPENPYSPKVNNEMSNNDNSLTETTTEITPSTTLGGGIVPNMRTTFTPDVRTVPNEQHPLISLLINGMRKWSPKVKELTPSEVEKLHTVNFDVVDPETAKEFHYGPATSLYDSDPDFKKWITQTVIPIGQKNGWNRTLLVNEVCSFMKYHAWKKKHGSSKIVQTVVGPSLKRKE